MTNESGSRRHPANRGSIGGGDQVVDAVLAAQGVGPWTTHRTLDPVRAAALTAAVTLCREPDVSTREVLTVAKEFESYLTGEKADDPS